MLYKVHEFKHAMMMPMRLQAQITKSIFTNPWNPLSHTKIGKTMAAGAEMIERSTRRFGKPEFGLTETVIDGKKVKVTETVVVEKPFCRLLNFKRSTRRKDPQVLLCAPMSGHYATLLRGTVEALLPHHNVYITDWEDAAQVPLSEGEFSLDTYITYLREFMSLLGPDTHVIAVCQPTVPVFAAISLMATENDPNQPLTLTMMGGPVDTRISKTEVTACAEDRPLKWFEDMAVHEIPMTYPGAGRKVYPGFLQLSGFMSMNLDTHVGKHMEFYHHLIAGDGDSAERHRKFYNEYMSVMDIPAEFYLQTVEFIFQHQLLPKGRMMWRDPISNELMPVRPQDIKHTALLTIEGELDDISARGQTTAAHELCHSLSQNKQYHYFQEKCGHYGIFNGGRWRGEIMPRIRHFIREFDHDVAELPKKDLEKVPDLAAERFNRDKHGVAAVRRWLRDHSADNLPEVID